MKKLNFRRKMLLRHTAVLLLFFIMAYPVMYIMVLNHIYSGTKDILISEAGQIISGFDAGVGTDDPGSIVDLVETGTYIAVFSDENEMISGKLPETSDLDIKPLFGNPYIMNRDGHKWMALDSALTVGGKQSGWFRVIKSLDIINADLAFLRKILVTITISLTVISIALMIGGGFLKEVLSPVKKITKTAQQVESGDLTKRICFEGGCDEVSALAETFNDMLDSIEDNFDREKRFSSDVSHELRTPVTAIIVSAEEALSGAESAAEYRESLKTILSEGKKMNSVISQLLMIARSSSGFAPETEPVDLSGLTRAIVDEVSGREGHPDIDILSDIDSGIVMLFDQTLYMRLVYNLIDNALKYNVPGGWVKVSLKKAEGDVVISVEDGGIGISEADQSKIWNRFYKVDKSAVNSSPGLGLSIVKWIAEQFCGDISVKSSPGKGSLFKVRFPAE